MVFMIARVDGLMGARYGPRAVEWMIGQCRIDWLTFRHAMIQCMLIMGVHICLNFISQSGYDDMGMHHVTVTEGHPAVVMVVRCWQPAYVLSSSCDAAGGTATTNTHTHTHTHTSPPPNARDH